MRDVFFEEQKVVDRNLCPCRTKAKSSIWSKTVQANWFLSVDIGRGPAAKILLYGNLTIGNSLKIQGIDFREFFLISVKLLGPTVDAVKGVIEQSDKLDEIFVQ